MNGKEKGRERLRTAYSNPGADVDGLDILGYITDKEEGGDWIPLPRPRIQQKVSRITTHH